MKFTRIKTADSPHNIIKLPELGRIRLGVKKVTADGKRTYPAETDYFVVPESVRKKFGDKPKILPVMIPVEDEEMFLRQFYACYGTNQKIKCMGNGEEAERRFRVCPKCNKELTAADKDFKCNTCKVDSTIIKKILPCPTPSKCDYAQEHGCRARTIVQLVLPDVNMGGVFTLSTGSINSDIDIRSGIEMARGLFNGRISWVPMAIEREEKKIPDPRTGNMMTHWPVKLYPTVTMEQVNIIRNETNRILEHSKRLALPEPIIEGELDDTPYELEEAPQAPEVKDFHIMFEEQIEKAETLPTLQIIWTDILKSHELAKNDATTNERRKKLNDLMKAKKANLTEKLPDGCTKDPNNCEHSTTIGDDSATWYCTKLNDEKCQFKAKEG